MNTDVKIALLVSTLNEVLQHREIIKQEGDLPLYLIREINEAIEEASK